GAAPSKDCLSMRPNKAGSVVATKIHPTIEPRLGRTKGSRVGRALIVIALYAKSMAKFVFDHRNDVGFVGRDIVARLWRRVDEIVLRGIGRIDANDYVRACTDQVAIVVDMSTVEQHRIDAGHRHV